MSRDDPDWKAVYALMRGNRRPTKVARPRKKLLPLDADDYFRTPAQRRAEQRDRKHELFVADMTRRKRWDILDDPAIAAYAFADWLKAQERRTRDRPAPHAQARVRRFNR